MRTALLQGLQSEQDLNVLRHLVNLITDVIAAIYDIEDNNWTDPYGLAKDMVSQTGKEQYGL